MKIKNFIYMIFVLVSVSSFIGGCAKTQEEKEIKKEGEKVSINLEATVFPSRVQQIVASSSGYVKNVYVKNGDKVKSGDILYSIDKEALRYDIRGARAELASLQGMRSAAWASYSSKSNLAAVNLAASELRDVSQLRSQGYTNAFDENNYKKNYINAVSAEKNSRMSDFERVKSIDAQIASKRATIAKMEYELGNANGISSVDGFISGLNITVGQPISIDAKICTIVNLDTVIVRGGFATGLLPFIHIGQKVDINFVTTPPLKTTAVVTQVNPVIDPDFHNMTVEVAIPNKNYLLQANTKALILISLSKDGQKTVNEYFSNKNDKNGIYEVKSAN